MAKEGISLAERGQKEGGVYRFNTYRKHPLNRVQTNNRFSGMDFDAIYRNGEPYEHQEYPKAIPIPIPDDDELPSALARREREFEDQNGQLHVWVEPEKSWRRRIVREWPNHFPVAEDEEHEQQIRKAYAPAVTAPPAAKKAVAL